MSSISALASGSLRRRRRLRFSLLALLVVITLACLFLGWWQFVHLEQQRFVTRRSVLAAHVKDLSAELKRKSDDYVDIARGMNIDDDSLLQVDLKRLDRLDEESLRIENELYNFQTKGKGKEVETGMKQLAERRKQQEQLRRDIGQRTRESASLKIYRDDLDRLQHMIDTFTEELERLNMEAEVRGIPSN
jgi:Tfp pilus assembly protein PilO